jgi:ribonuclease HII
MARKKAVLRLPPAPNLDHELELRKQHFKSIAGLDEAGRGAWAGPVAAGAVILPNKKKLLEVLKGVNDSKQLSAEQRDYWAVVIRSEALTWGLGFASHEEIDELGIISATRLAMTRALQQLAISPDHLIIDALKIPQVNLPQTALIKGDCRSLSIAAASILAKTARDAYMKEQDKVFPEYGFARHKGYGTLKHQENLKKFGPCIIHRRSFNPMRENLWMSSDIDLDDLLS